MRQCTSPPAAACSPSAALHSAPCGNVTWRRVCLDVLHALPGAAFAVAPTPQNAASLPAGPFGWPVPTRFSHSAMAQRTALSTAVLNTTYYRIPATYERHPAEHRLDRRTFSGVV